MYHEENLGKYFNNLRRILRSKLELLDYYEQVVRYQELEKKAFLRLVFQRPVYCIIRSIVYLPMNILCYLDRIADRFYLSKIIFKYYNGSAFVTVFEVSTSGATATIPSTVTIEGESDPNAITFAIALGG